MSFSSSSPNKYRYEKLENIYNVCQAEELKDIISIEVADTYFVAIDKQNIKHLKGQLILSENNN